MKRQYDKSFIVPPKTVIFCHQVATLNAMHEGSADKRQGNRLLPEHTVVTFYYIRFFGERSKELLKKLVRAYGKDGRAGKVRLVPGDDVIRPFAFRGCGNHGVLKVGHFESQGCVNVRRGCVANTDKGFEGRNFLFCFTRAANSLTTEALAYDVIHVGNGPRAHERVEHPL